MIAYHEYLLQRRRNPTLDFLTFWYQEARLEDSASEALGAAETADGDILLGIQTLRDRAVEASRNKKVSLAAVRLIVAQIRAGATFDESRQYWDSVYDTLQQTGTDLDLSELSEAVLSFLRNLESPDPSEPPTSYQDDMEELRRFVSTSIDAVRTEIKRESVKLKREIESATSTAASSPLTAPSLPVPSRRGQEQIVGSRDMRDQWCGSCADWDGCVQQ